MIKIKILPENVLLEVEIGSNLLNVFREKGIDIESDCGGKGWCGKCKVRLAKGKVTELNDVEKRMLKNEEINRNIRLACQLFLIEDNIEVEVMNKNKKIEIVTNFLKSREGKKNPLVRLKPFKLEPPSLKDQRSDLERLSSIDTNLHFEDLRLLRNLPHLLREYNFEGKLVIFKDEIIDIRDRNFKSIYGVAFDIGTTTIVGYLLDMNDLREVDIISRVNPQRVYGSDVLSRISFILQNSDGVDILHKVLIRTLEEIILEFSKRNHINLDDIYAISIAGNSVMTHIFLGISPEYISYSPFSPAFRDSLVISSREIFSILPKAKLYIFPLVSGYIGGDIVAGIIATDLLREKGNILFIDIGTNGEIVLKVEDRLYSCATAAGPAFEGGNISCGMIASQGAIDHVWLKDGKVFYSVIGGGEEKGITGSGLLDAISVMLELGILDSKGRINDEEFYIGKIKITQRDIREFQLAKSAIRAGIEVLMRNASIGYDKIDKIYIAGAFGNYIDKENALKIKLLPPISKDNIFLVGNSSGMGAKLVLLDKEIIEKAKEISKKIEYIELSSNSEFNKYFVEFMYF